MGLSVCARTLVNVFASVCACGSMQRLIHNDDRKYSIISSHSVVFTKQQGGKTGAGGKRRERGGVAVDWKRWRWSETKTDRDGERKMKHRQREEMSMLIQLYHNYVLRNNGDIYNVPVILHQQLQYIYYLSFLQTLPAYSHHLLKSGVCLKVSIYCMVDKCCSSSDCIFLWKVCAVLFGYSNVMKFHWTFY